MPNDESSCTTQTYIIHFVIFQKHAHSGVMLK